MQFECGLLSPEAFGEGLKRELKLEVDCAEILDHFTQWPQGLFGGAHDLLLELGKSYRLAALTNTNALHWPRLVNEFHLPQYFTAIFAWHQIALAKPDPLAFRHVVDSLNVLPEQILFFDDNPANVATSRQLGILGHQVRSVEQIKDHLHEFGLLTV